MYNLTRKIFLRVFLGCGLIIAGCVLGFWQYTLKELAKNTGSINLYNQYEEAINDQGPDALEEVLKIRKGDNLTTIFKRAGFSYTQGYSIINALKEIFNPSDLRTDNTIVITYNFDKQVKHKKILSLVIKLSIDTAVIVRLMDDNLYKAEKIQKELVHEIRYARGNIQESLYVDAAKQGTHPKVLHQMIKAFSYDIDFQRGFHTGDSYYLLFDYYKEHETGLEKPGNLLYAELTLKGNKIEIYRFKSKNGITNYYKPNGECVKKGLLRTPIDGARISSRFGYRKKHPVSGYGKMHHGVDFAAPKGTPINAAGSGKIVQIGSLGSYGNYIKIQHNANYATAYAHLHRFTKGLKKHQTVRQGQIIGYVGSTGRSTGPHLHYEVILNGKKINPSKVKMLPNIQLKSKELQAFLVAKAKINKRLKNNLVNSDS